MSMEEIWKDIEGYEGYYQVSNLGRVRSVTRKVKTANGLTKLFKSKILSLKTKKNGYLECSLCIDSNTKSFLVHRLVALAFTQNPDGKSQINHINGIKEDNRLENLEWSNNSENQKHAFKTGLKVSVKGEKCGKHKLTEELIHLIREDLKTMGRRKVAKKYDITPSHVFSIKYGKIWKHI